MATAESDAPVQVEIALDVSVLGLPMTIGGAVQGGKVSQLGGSARVPAGYSLGDLIGGLKEDDKLEAGKAGDALSSFLGSPGSAPHIRLTGLAFGMTIGEPRAAHFVADVAVGERCSLKFLAAKNGDNFLVGVDVRCDQTFNQGNALSGVLGEISIRSLGLFYASEAVPQFPLPSSSSDSLELLVAPPTLRDFSQGFSFAADIRLGGIALRYGPPEASPNGKPARTVKSTKPDGSTRTEPGGPPSIEPDGSTFWWEANTTIGPVLIRRVGFSYYDAPRPKDQIPTKYIGIKFDATLSLGPIAFSLVGAGIRYPFDELLGGGFSAAKFWKNLEFQFDGASLSFSQGPLTISGGLIRVSETPLQLDGTLLIKAAGFSFMALGSYRDVGGQPSFFLFVVLLKELGGPPCFFVTGLAFGLGINRRLKLPDLSGVREYPLVKAACDPAYLGPGFDLRGVSAKLAEFITPSMGDYWIAAGVRFVSFGMVDSFVLLSVAFGTRFEIGVLGLSIIRVPMQVPGIPPAAQPPVIAYAELVVRVAITPEAGILAAEAKLTENSYVLFKDCKLTGGFAFYSWFGANPHRDDFVLTLGGYHPRFQVPMHYPRPERLGLRCRLEDWGIDIQGSCYFALTPSAIMAGGGLSIVFDEGWVRAWFIVQADFLIQWKPFYYDIEIGASIGLELILGDPDGVSIVLRLELSARVLLCGPPLGGWAEVTWCVITVRIKLGDEPEPKKIKWDDPDPDKSFIKSFLGVETGRSADETLLQLDVPEGLLMEIKKNGQVTARVVRAHGLVLTTNSVIPASTVKVDGNPLVEGKVFGVRPLREKDRPSPWDRLDSVLLDVTVNRNGPGAAPLVTAELTTRSLPSALWGTEKFDPRVPPKPDALVKDLPAGVRLKFEAPDPLHHLPVMELKNLAFEDVVCTACRWGSVPPTQTIAGQPPGVTISSTIMEEVVSQRRQAVLDELATLDAPRGSRMAPRKVNLSYLGAKTPAGADPHDTLVFHAPVICSNVGQLPILERV